MAETVIKVCRAFLYGKSVLDGYYSSTKTPKEEKKYIFSSVFPSSGSMKKILAQASAEK